MLNIDYSILLRERENPYEILIMNLLNSELYT